MADKPALSKIDLGIARNGLYEARVAEQELERCRACGLDVGQLEQRCQHLKGFLERVIATYSNLPANPPDQPS